MGNMQMPYIYPRQKLPRAEKDEKWGIENVRYILSLASAVSFSQGTHGSSEAPGDYRRKKISYDLYNNILDKSDFTYVTNPYGVENEFPARFTNYNQISPKINVLLGEEIKRPFNYKVVAVNEEAISELEEQRKELLLQHLESELMQTLQSQGLLSAAPQQASPQPAPGQGQDPTQDPAQGGGGDPGQQPPQQQAPPQPPPPSPIQQFTQDEIQKYQNYSMSDLREVTANRIIEYLHKQQLLDFKFNKGFKDALIAGEEIYYVGIEHGEPIVENINPLDFAFDKSPDLDWIQDGQWGMYVKYCTPSAVIDMFYDKLTEEQITMIDTGNFYQSGMDNVGFGPKEDRIVPITYSKPNFREGSKSGFIKVARVEWKSLRKIGFLKYYDQDQEEQQMIVDESYTANKKAGEEIDWKWIGETWQGTQIMDDIFLDIKPKELQLRSRDNPSKSKLSYVGALYNNRNSENVSLVDLVKPHQYLFNILMYRMELEIAKAKGKKMVVDLAQIPKSQGFNLEKWMYYFDSVGIAFINSFEEGTGVNAGRTPSFNQFTAVDMSLSESVGQYVNLLSKVEAMIGELMGVSPQRQGAVSSQETVGGVEHAIVQSSFVTEPIFYLHGEIKRWVLENLIEAGKYCWKDGSKKINYIMDDLSRTIINVGDEFLNADYGIFTSNQSRDNQVLEGLRALAQQAMSSGMMSLKEAAVILQSNSIAEIKNTIEQSEAAKQQEQQTQQQYQLQQIQAKEQADFEKEKYKEDQKNSREDKKTAAMVQVAQIASFSHQVNQDANSDGVPDQLEVAKLAQKAQGEAAALASQERIADKRNAVEKYKADKDAEVARVKISQSSKPKS